MVRTGVGLPALGLHVSFELNTTSITLGRPSCHITHPSLPHTLRVSLAGRGLITLEDFAWMQENHDCTLHAPHWCRFLRTQIAKHAWLPLLAFGHHSTRSLHWVDHGQWVNSSGPLQSRFCLATTAISSLNKVKNSSGATSLPTAREAAEQSTRVFRII